MLCNPHEEPSINGLLPVTLTAANDFSRGPSALAYESGGVVCEEGIPGFSGRIPGPTLVLQPGDRLKLTLKNALIGDKATNLHFHGLHVSPIANSDNVFVAVKPGEEFPIEVHVPDLHPSGLFWYHPHVHHEAQQQVLAGLAGAIIITERTDEPPAITSDLLQQGARYPGPMNLEDRLLVLQHLSPGLPSTLDALVVNGQILPQITIGQNETQRWRLLNASANDFFNVRVVGHRLARIAVDGNYIPNYTEFPEIHVLPLGPAERAEVLITGGEPGTYPVRVLKRMNPLLGEFMLDAPYFADPEQPFDDGMMAEEYHEVATLVVSADAAAVPEAAPPQLVSALARNLAADYQPDREIKFVRPLHIDGKGFEAGRVDQTVKKEATEIWRIFNEIEADVGWHPFHLHVNDFDVLKIHSPDGDQLEPAFYQDTVPVPPKVGTDPGWVDIRSDFRDFTGRFVFHCHFLTHEDSGMMAAVEVVEPITIASAGFDRESVTVTVGSTVPGGVNGGATVVWTNDQRDSHHTVTADATDDSDQPLFDSGDLEYGRSFAHTFDSPGLATYHCRHHPEETGSIVVTAEKTVEIVAAGFDAQAIEVATGTKVTWTNRLADAHTVTADDLDPATGAPIFASGPLAQKQSYSFTFPEAGEFAYASAAAPGWTGTVVVKDALRRSVSIGIFNDRLDQPVITIPAGSTVTWANRSKQPYTIAAEIPPFTSGTLDAEVPYEPDQPFRPGQRFSFRFNAPITGPSSVTYTATPLPGATPPPGDTTPPATMHTGTINVVP
jgi:FtsP/CotA-like multicopper oxidase with cupredoxin domain